MLGDKRGDNGQVEMVAQALGWPCERRNLVMRPRYAVRKPWVRPSLHHIDLARSDPLEPPWPDLIITIGRRPSAPMTVHSVWPEPAGGAWPSPVTTAAAPSAAASSNALRSRKDMRNGTGAYCSARVTDAPRTRPVGNRECLGNWSLVVGSSSVRARATR